MLNISRSFNRTASYVALRTIKLTENSTLQPGDKIPATVRLPLLRAWHRLGKIGEEGSAFSLAALAALGVRPRVEVVPSVRTGPPVVAELPDDTESVEKPRLILTKKNKYRVYLPGSGKPYTANTASAALNYLEQAGVTELPEVEVEE